jgi:hypothetical protein
VNYFFLFLTISCFAGSLSDEIYDIDLSRPRFKCECPWVFRKRKVFVKRRWFDNVNDVSAWQLCQLLEMENIPEAIAYCAGSYWCVIQRAIPLNTGKLYHPPTSKFTSRVSLEEYWKAALLSFVLGFEDLHGANIGITSDGKIIYFDNDNLYNYTTTLSKSGAFFHHFFVTSLMDWPQYQHLIDESLAQKLQALVQLWKSKQAQILQHPLINQHRPDHVPDNYLESIVERINILSSFNFASGINFQNFYAFLYPELASGLDDLRLIVNQKTLHKMERGSALFYCSKNATDPNLKDSLTQWETKYIRSRHEKEI